MPLSSAPRDLLALWETISFPFRLQIGSMMRILRASGTPSRARRYLAVSGAALALGAAAIVATPGAAHAWSDAPPGEIYSAATWQCLDSDSAGDVYLAWCDGSNTQVWQYDWDGNLQDAQTGLCLTYTFIGLAAAPCTAPEGEYQAWIRYGASPTIFWNAADSELCLDLGSQGDVTVNTCDGSATQDWYVFD